MVQSYISEIFHKKESWQRDQTGVTLFGLDIGTIIPGWPGNWSVTVPFFGGRLWIDAGIWRKQKVSQFTIALFR